MPRSNDIHKGFRLEIPLFPDYIIPNGGLTNERESHALFYYYILAMQMYDREKNGVVYEGDKDPEFNYRNVFLSVANLYGIRPENMVNAWPSVDVTCTMHNMPLLPREAKYRQNGYNRGITLIN